MNPCQNCRWSECLYHAWFRRFRYHIPGACGRITQTANDPVATPLIQAVWPNPEACQALDELLNLRAAIG